MLAALKYKQNILDNFYLDDDDITIRRKKDDTVKGKFKKHQIVKSYTLRGEKGNDYRGIHIPGIGSGVSISLPWVLTVLRNISFEDNSIIDHIDGDITNNSRNNLRIVTQSINCRNTKQRCDNTSGYTGLSFHKPTGRWVVRRTLNKKRVWRSAPTFDEALEIWKRIDRISKKRYNYSARHGK